MEDNKIWFYIIAAIIYFLTRKKKKKNQPPQTERTTESNRPQQKKEPVSFEDLLKEITEGREEEPTEQEVVVDAEPIVEVKKEEKPKERIRHFADDESRKIYEESIARAQAHDEGHDHRFEPDDDYVSHKMFKHVEVDEGPSIADEIREGLQNHEDAKKAIIYSEILSRKF